jgi:hypothetical protein
MWLRQSPDGTNVSPMRGQGVVPIDGAASVRSGQTSRRKPTRKATGMALSWLVGTAALSWATLYWFVPILISAYAVGFSVQAVASLAFACGLFVALVMVVLGRPLPR